MTSFTIDRANAYIAEHAQDVILDYKPQAHFSAPIGWINDPNGFVFFRGEYHLFYQYYPYDTQWGPMHWGHAKSKDGLHWEHLPVALAPDQAYDKDGCFSGSALVKEDRLWLMYTGHLVGEDGTVRQVQNMAFSDDGIHFEKIAQNPVLGETDLPETINPSDFRDPKIFEKDGHYYAVVAAKQTDETGCIVLVGSEDLLEWQFESIFLKGNPDLGIMWECPDYFQLGGKDCLIMSPMRVPKDGYSYHNINSTFFMTGTVNWEDKVFELETVEELDHGHDFYAPQTTEDDQGRRIMIAWQHTWGRQNITHDLGHQWAMSMTIPRELSLKDGILYQETLAVGALGEALDLASPLTVPAFVTIDNPSGASFELHIGSSEDYVSLIYDNNQEVLWLDRSGLKQVLAGEEVETVSARAVKVKESQLDKLSIIIDANSLEVLVNEGSASLSSNVYFQKETVAYLRLVSGACSLKVQAVD